MAVAGENDSLSGVAPASAAAVTHHVLQFRGALIAARDANQSAAGVSATEKDRIRARQEAAGRPLVDRAYAPLLRFCNRLVRQSALRGYAEADDLAHDAWSKVITYLTGPNGDRVQDDEHFVRLLNRAALTRLLDLLPRARREDAAPQADALEGRASAWGVVETRTPEDKAILLSGEGQHDLIAILFRDEDAFRRINRQRKNARHPRQYHALVLYGLGERYRGEIGAEPDATDDGTLLAAWLFDTYVEALGVPQTMWKPVRAAALSPPADGWQAEGGDALEGGLAKAVNGVCETNVRDRKTLAVYRYELNQLVEIARAER